MSNYRLSRRLGAFSTVAGNGDGNIEELCRLWCLRIAASMPLFRRSPSAWYQLNDQTQELMGLERLDMRARSVAQIMMTVRPLLRKAERLGTVRSGRMVDNADLLTHCLDLSAKEREVLLFAAGANCLRPVRELVELFNGGSADLIGRLVATACAVEDEVATRAIAPEGTLCSSGIILRGPGVYESSEHPLRLPDPVARMMLNRHDSIDGLLAGCFGRSPAAAFGFGDFDHLGDDLAIMQKYLAAALAKQQAGVNVLLYGPPGVGKTELSRTITAAAGGSLYEVLVEDADRTSRSQRERIESFNLAQGLLKRRKDALLLFDEAEDLFPVESHSFFGPTNRSHGDKGWVVKLLEKNPVPVIWIANQIGQIDPAYLRRFDLCLEIKVPPEATRKRVLAKSFATMRVRPEWVDRVAAAENLTPADAAVAAKVVRTLDEVDPAACERLAERVLEGNLAARGLTLKPPRNNLLQNDPVYHIDYLNTDIAIGPVARGLAERLCGAVLLYGPPGTGKTAFAWHVGTIAGKPVVARRGSDLLSMYVGGTEANIAAMFREAGRTGSILLLDEADGFFADRRGAQRPWEVTQVNELLVQMEGFSGLFICSTNLMERLDQASFRRFALKIRFDYLTYSQRIRLFEAHAAALGLAGAGEDAERDMWHDVLRPLDRLTPGDIVAVRRQQELIGGFRHIHDFAQAVAKECASRPGARKSGLGFGGSA